MEATKNLNVKVDTYERLFRRKTHPKESMNAVITKMLDHECPKKDK